MLRASLKLKAAILFAAFFLSAVLSFWSLLFAGSIQKTYAGLINAAGRQRALSQIMAKEAVYILLGQGGPESETNLKNAYGTFEQTLTGFIEGSPDSGFPPAQDPALISELNGLKQEEWQTFKTDLDLVLQGRVANMEDMLGTIKKDNLLVFQRANKVTQMYEELSGSKMDFLRNLQIAVLLANGILVLAGWYWTTRFIIRPIIDTSERLRDIAQGEGDLTMRLPGDRKDEIGDLTRWFNNFVSKIQGIIAPVRETAELVDKSAGVVLASVERSTAHMREISGSAVERADQAQDQMTFIRSVIEAVQQLNMAVSQIALAAQDQARNVFENNGQIEEMNQRISAVHEITRHLQQLAEQSVNTAQKGSSAVDDSMVGMQKIEKTVTAFTERIMKLGEKTQEIGTIIEVIDEIADQTNLLSLNAAIEAARAGEYGKGFAVVAEEVRRLAEKSTTATKEIAILVKTIQEETGRAVAAMEEGNREVVTGAGIVRTAGDALSEIVAMVQQTGHRIAEITGALGKVQEASERVASSTVDLSAIAEENSASAEEMLASSEEVSRTMNKIGEITGENTGAFAQVAAAVNEINDRNAQTVSEVERMTERAMQLRQLVARFKV